MLKFYKFRINNKIIKIIARILFVIFIILILLLFLTSCQVPKQNSNKVSTIKSQLNFLQSLPLPKSNDNNSNNSNSSNKKYDLSSNLPQIEKITLADRILILAPHPDDEVIATAGIIQESLKLKAKVKVVFLTNGDSERNPNIYLKNLPYSNNTFLLLGELRRKEAIDALNKLGLSENNIVFLGYPDAGTLNILLSHWDVSNPYKNNLTKSTFVPYKECYSPGSIYIGGSILNDLEKIIENFNPTKIFVSCPFDMHSDHRAFYLFLRVALWDLKNKVNYPEIYTYLTHYKNWPDFKGYFPDKILTPPTNFQNINDINWINFYLTDEEIKKKYDSINSYKSQLNFGPLLISFDKKNEIFACLNDINLKNNILEVYINNYKNNTNNINNKSNNVENKIKNNEIIWHASVYSNLYYSIINNNLFVNIVTKQKINNNFYLSIYFLGYSNKIEFSKMPKIQIKIDKEKLKIFNNDKEIFDKDIYFKINDNNNLIIGIPLSLMKNPQYILNGIETQSNYLSNSLFGWRVIYLN